jgi:hypothetical protein
MEKEKTVVLYKEIRSKIYTIRKQQVMLDSDLAELYEVPVKRLNEQVKRNLKRFPDYYMFQLNKEEYSFLRSQFATLKRGQHRKYLPRVFTEHGVSQLASVLNSEIAIDMSIKIIDAFIVMRKILSSNSQIFQRLTQIEYKQIEYDKKIEYVLKELGGSDDVPKQGIFFSGQIYDAYKFVTKLIKQAEQSLILIDNFIDDSVLTMLDQRKKKVSSDVFTREIDKKLKLSLEKHNKQYLPINIHITKDFHDRFLIIDNKAIYHIGASLKDLGKKCFAFSKMESKELDVLIKKIKK